MLALKSDLGGERGACVLVLEFGIGGVRGAFMLSRKSSTEGEEGIEAWMLAFNPFLCGDGACILALNPGLTGEGGE